MIGSFEEWFGANTKELKKVAAGNDEAMNSLAWIEYELQNSHKIMKWYEDAVKEVCSDDEYARITKLYMTYMNNDFIVNTEIGRELAKAGALKPSGLRILFGGDAN